MKDRRKRNSAVTLEMKIGEETRAKISRIGRQDSLLYHTYLRAFRVLNAVISSEERSESVDTNASSVWNNPESMVNCYNNIIPFIAGRGRGKTSAMLTFGNTIKGLDKLSDKSVREWEHGMSKVFDSPSKELINTVSELRGVRFKVLDPIDPSILRRDHDIITVFLAQMYESYNDITKDDSICSFDYQCLKNEFLEDIEKSYSAVCALDAKHSDQWTLQKFEKISAATELKRSLYETAKTYLKLIEYNGRKNYIVLQIDDADMNYNWLYSILEDIRSFLMIPNLIVLMAADISMMENIIEKRLKADAPVSTKEKFQELIEQYMLKFFPPYRQIHLPDLSELLQRDREDIGLYAFDSLGNDEVDVFESLYTSEVTARKSMEQELIQLLYQRTGIYLYSRDIYHPLLPSSQRGIANFTAMLYHMKKIPMLEQSWRLLFGEKPESNELYGNKNIRFFYPFGYQREGFDIEVSDGTYQTELSMWRENLRQFREYFLNDWSCLNLSKEEQDLLSLMGQTSIESWNDTVKQWFTERKDESVQTRNGEDGGKGAGNGISPESRSKQKEEGTVRYQELLAVLEEKDIRDSKIVRAVHMLYDLFVKDTILDSLQKGNKEKFEGIFADFDVLDKLFSEKLIAEGSANDIESVKSQAKVKIDEVMIHNSRKHSKVYGIMWDNMMTYRQEENGDRLWGMDAPLCNAFRIHIDRIVFESGENIEAYTDDFGQYLEFQDLCLLIMSNWDLLKYFRSAFLDQEIYSKALSETEKNKQPAKKNSRSKKILDLFTEIYKQACKNTIAYTDQEIMKDLQGRMTGWTVHHDTTTITWDRKSQTINLLPMIRKSGPKDNQENGETQTNTIQ